MADSDSDRSPEETPDAENTFQAWWVGFLADWHRRYPHEAPPSEESARVAFAESQAARARHGTGRPAHRPPLGDGRQRLA